MMTVALIGRTNVGKSTLFNRILGEGKALVSPLAHTTRDRNVGTTTWRGVECRVFDTGGVEGLEARSAAPRARHPGTIEGEIRRQVELAIHDADLLALVVDSRDGILPGERAIARHLRSLGKPILVVANKAETVRRRHAALEFAALGFGEPIPTSAATGMGVGDLLDRIVAYNRKTEADDRKHIGETHDGMDMRSAGDDRPSTIHVAILGEPNVGKSSLLNAMLGREEVIVLPEPFTTRDVHDVDVEVDGRTVTVLDTAGIRRAAIRATAPLHGRRVTTGAIERRAAARSMAAIERADVVVLVLDATRPATRHTKQLAQAIADAGRACVIVINKMDLLRSERTSASPDQLISSVHRLFPHLAWAPVIATSATEGTNVSAILPTAIRAAASRNRQLSPDDLARVHAAVKRRIPTPRTAFDRRRSTLLELQQTDAAPPRFLLMTRPRVKLPKAIPAIVERVLRASADFTGTPIRITVKSRKA